MKAPLLIFFVCAYTYSTQVHGSVELPPNLEEIIQRKCDSSSGDTRAFYRIKEESDSLLNCLGQSLSIDISDPLLQHEFFCKTLRESNAYACVSNFTDALRPCLAETEAYLPNFLLTAVNNTYNELCGVNGPSNLEYLFNLLHSRDPEVYMCLKVTGDLLIGETTISNLKIYRNLRNNSIMNLNAKDLCSDLESIYQRFGFLMKQECNQDHSRLVDLYCQPVLEACNIL